MAMARFLVLALCLLNLHRAYCTEFDVGDRDGWAVPPPNDTEFYNHWASKNRFKVDDTISKLIPNFWKYLLLSCMQITNSYLFLFMFFPLSSSVVEI